MDLTHSRTNNPKISLLAVCHCYDNSCQQLTHNSPETMCQCRPDSTATFLPHGPLRRKTWKIKQQISYSVFTTSDHSRCEQNYIHCFNLADDDDDDDTIHKMSHVVPCTLNMLSNQISIDYIALPLFIVLKCAKQLLIKCK